jgi:parvulin-like peptidyl-prolyl isomerase
MRMGRTPYIVTLRGALVMLAVLVFVVLAGGCGSSSSNSDVIVNVGSHKITKAELDHWGPIESRLAYDSKPVKQLPRGVVPDPPGFGECIALVKATAQEAKPKPLAADKQECQQKYAAARRSVLEILIIYYWLVDEGHRKHVEFSDQEVQQGLRSYVKRTFRSDGEYRDYLTASGLTASDDLLLVKKNMLATRLESEATRGKGPQPKHEEAALEAFYQAFEAGGKAETSCEPGYVVHGCKESSR